MLGRAPIRRTPIATARCIRATPRQQIARTYELADLHSVNLLGAVTWAFEFEDQPYFAGFRDLATNGIDKPVLNVFRMLGQMRGDASRSTAARALPLDAIRDGGVRERPDVNALATRDERARRRAGLELSRRRSSRRPRPRSS